MTSTEIRTKFLNYFQSKGHTHIASDSVVPKDDPTVLFTTAGMQQFKQQFLGNIDKYTRACTSQKCIRTDDLEEVGQTDFHHTFFEMLGNFSFGDYFKKEAIEWAWEFLTRELKIDSEKLWVSVYKDDMEAREIWIKKIGISEKKLVMLGDHSNFWPADAKENGPNGPCGPCSEIFYDYGQNPNCTNKNCNPDCDCGRFSEIWNLVFTQFERKEGGKLIALPNKNIDTGMGLERLTAVVQGKKSNYETDLFLPIIDAIDKHLKKNKCTLTQTEKYIIADHIRAVVFSITDGVMPSNENRGYVIKKLIIEVSDILLCAHVKKPQISHFADIVETIMSKTYPEISEKSENIKNIIDNIEIAYIKVRKERIPEFLKSIKKGMTNSKNLGELFFIFRDTHGLTIETMNEILKDLSIDTIILTKAWEQYHQLMKKQREQSRASSKMTGDVFIESQINLNVPKTKFIGYNQISANVKILKLFTKNKEVDSVKQEDKIQMITDQTPFYAESGGQIADTGYFRTDTNKIRILKTQKTNDVFIHVGIVENGTFKKNDLVEGSVDNDRRLSIMRNHTATHLLQAAMREILGTHIQQQGSYVGEDRLRFDFTHPTAVKKDELKQIEKKVNNFIIGCDPVVVKNLNLEEAKKEGALAFFAEKYGDIVRIVAAGNYSKEFCGGTHCQYTGQIGLFKIVSESAIAQGIRRIEAVTGTVALENSYQQNELIEELSKKMKSSTEEILPKLNFQQKRLKELENQLASQQWENIQKTINNILENKKSVGEIDILSSRFKDLEMNLLRKISDSLKKKTSSSIIVLGAQTKENASLLLAVTDDLVKKGFKANELISDIAPLINGSGGGRPQLACAGSKEPEKVKEALEKANKLIEEKIRA